jgi:PAS domain S-box-containing protein
VADWRFVSPIAAASDSELRFLWLSPIPATLQDERFRLVDVNDAYVAFCGWPRSQLIGRDPIEFQPEPDRAANLAQREAIARQGGLDPKAAPLRRRLVDAAGYERWFALSAARVRGEDGAVLWLSLLQDLTGEHEARDEGRRAQDELATWFELASVGMIVFDNTGWVVRTNPVFETLIGRVLTRVDDADEGLQRLLGWRTGAAGLPLGGAPIERHATLTLPDGRRRHLLARLARLPGDDRLARFMAVLADRSAEAERDVAEHEIGVLMDTASVGVATYDHGRGWIESRRAPEGRGGGGRAMLGINRELIEPASLPEYERLQRALREGLRTEVRYAVRHPELGQRWLLTRVEPTPRPDGKLTSSVVTLDVTERETAQQRTEQLLRELSTILDGSSAGIGYLRGDVLVRCNRRFERMLGYEPGAAAGATLAEAFARRFDAAALLPAIRQALEASRPYEAELRAGGSPPAWYSLSVKRAEGGAAGLEAVAVLSDITRLKAQQAELESALRERELMFNLSEVGIAYMRGSRIERANQAMADLTGFAAPELTALDGAELYADARECVEFEAATAAALEGQGRFVGERRLRRRDGTLRWVQVSARPAAADDAREGVIASFVDVDERHRARETLVLQAERTRAMLDSVLVGIVTVGANGIEWMNRSARRMFGGELADFVGEPIATVASAEPEHPLRRSAEHMQRLAEGQAETFECRLKARDGREFWVVGNVVLTAREAGRAQLTYALLDIERRRQAEISIAQAQASLQRVIETAPLAIALFDAATLRLVQLNQMASAFFGPGAAELPGRSLEDACGLCDAAPLSRWLAQAPAGHEVLRREWHHGRGGTLRVWDARAVRLEPSGGAPPQILLVASDVTEQRAADAARLQAAIAQRELLVREVHHRIKNNLQGVAGLLQHNAARHPDVALLLNEAVTQVQAIAQVYGLQVGESGPLRLARLLPAIAASVQRTFGRTIAVDDGGAAASAISLPEAEAIPIALTVNELLTNAVKHGEAGSARCSIEVEGDTVLLAVGNRGRLHEGFRIEQVPGGISGLGLVRALLPRKSAQLTIEQRGDQVFAGVRLRDPSVYRDARLLAPESAP